VFLCNLIILQENLNFAFILIICKILICCFVLFDIHIERQSIVNSLFDIYFAQQLFCVGGEKTFIFSCGN